MNKVLNLVNTNFDEETKEGIVLVDFWAAWCGPCRMIAPILDKLSKDEDIVSNNIKIAKVNVDDNQDLTLKFDVKSIPSIFVMKDGKIIDSMVGPRSFETLKEILLSKI